MSLYSGCSEEVKWWKLSGSLSLLFWLAITCIKSTYVFETLYQMSYLIDNLSNTYIKYVLLFQDMWNVHKILAGRPKETKNLNWS